MILVDTSVWVEHFKRGDPALIALLNASRVLTHPFVIGELRLGNLRTEPTVLALLASLPMASTASDSELLHIIAAHKLAGRGIGLVDAHLVASALLDSAQLYTQDKQLGAVAEKLKLRYLHK